MSSTPRPARMVRQARPARNGIPDATVARLPVYLRALTALAAEGVDTVSSEALAAAAGVSSAKLRKDLSHLGSYGTRGVGYDVEYLVYQISRELGLTQDWRGRHRRASATSATRWPTTAASPPAVSASPRCSTPTRAGSASGSPAWTSGPSSDLERVVARPRACTSASSPRPAESAQEVCDRLVAAGVTSILNFAPCVLDVPDGVDVRKVDLSTELQILAFHEQRKVATRLAAAGRGAAGDRGDERSRRRCGRRRSRSTTPRRRCR